MATFDVTIEGWDGQEYRTRLQGGDAILAWPGKRVTVTPLPAKGEKITALFRAARSGRGVRFRADGATRSLAFRVSSGTSAQDDMKTRLDTTLMLMIPEIVRVDSNGFISHGALKGYPLGNYPRDVPARYRDRARAFENRVYVVTDSSLFIASVAPAPSMAPATLPPSGRPGFRLGDFFSKIRPDRIWNGTAHPLAIDYGLVNVLEKIETAWRADGYPGRVRIESPYRTPDYNNADAAGRATFSQHMYGSACDIIFTAEDDHLHDDVDRDGDRDMDDLLPLARMVEQMMKDGRIPKGGIGVYHYIHRDTRAGTPEAEEFTIHVDLRGKIGKWGSLYDSDTVKAAAEIDW